MKVNFTLNPVSFARSLLLVMVVLVVLNLGAVYLFNLYGNLTNEATGDPGVQSLGQRLAKTYVRLFSVDRENSFPSFFSFCLMGISSAFLFLIARIERPITGEHQKWKILGLVFAFLAVDELFAIHETLMFPMRLMLRSALDTKDLGVLHYAWIVPYAAVLVFLAAYFFRFVFSLPRKTLVLFILSGFVFVGGAVGMEMIGGKIVSNGGSTTSLLFGLVYTLEEAMEMIGVILFIYSLLSYIKEYRGLTDLNVVLKPKARSAEAAPPLVAVD